MKEYKVLGRKYVSLTYCEATTAAAVLNYSRHIGLMRGESAYIEYMDGSSVSLRHGYVSHINTRRIKKFVAITGRGTFYFSCFPVASIDDDGREHVEILPYYSGVAADMAMLTLACPNPGDHFPSCYDCGEVITNGGGMIAGECFCEDCVSEWAECNSCGEACKIDESFSDDYKTVCESCYDDYYFTCEDCGEICYFDDCVTIDGGTCDEKYVCSDCAERNYYKCVGCGEYFSRERACYTDGDNCVCDDCVDEYSICDDCGVILSRDCLVYCECDDCFYCEECIGDHVETGVHDYYYKPDPVFYGAGEYSGKRFYGVELEIDNGDDVSDFVDDAEPIADGKMYFKHDGSLSDGVEIVSHPATLEFHMNGGIPWDEIIDTAREHGFTSHDAGTCGLHVHVSRASMGDDAPEKLLALVDSLWEALVILSRRKESQLRNWARKPDADISSYDCAEIAKDKACKCNGKGRYQAVNLQNRNTIEFRFFRGTLKKQSFFAALQIIDGLCEFSENHTLSECVDAEWKEFYNSIPFSEFKKYCDERGF